MGIPWICVEAAWIVSDAFIALADASAARSAGMFILAAAAGAFHALFRERTIGNVLVFIAKHEDDTGKTIHVIYESASLKRGRSSSGRFRPAIHEVDFERGEGPHFKAIYSIFDYFEAPRDMRYGEIGHWSFPYDTHIR